MASGYAHQLWDGVAELASVAMPLPIQFLVFVLVGWVTRQQQDVIEYLKAENRRSVRSWEASGFASRMRSVAVSPERRRHSEDAGSASSRRSSPRIPCFAGTGSSSPRSMTGAHDAVPADLGSPARSKA